MAGFRAWLALEYCVRRGEPSHIRVRARCEASKAPAGLDGFYQPTQRTIGISSNLTSDNARAATRVHELAHALVRLDHDKQDPQLDYGEEELVAESVA